MNPRRKRRKTIRFVERMILGGNIKIESNPDSTKLVNGCPEQVDSYDIYPKTGDFLAVAPKWFDRQNIAVVSLVKMDDELFFPDFALEINHNAFDIPVRKARWLYDQVESAKKQSSQQPVKTM